MGHDSMDVDCVYSKGQGAEGDGKNKGKDKSKGKPVKGKTKDKNFSQKVYHAKVCDNKSKFDGSCDACNKCGHKAADCWRAPQNKDSKTGAKVGSHAKGITEETTTVPSQQRRITAENE